MIQSTRKVSENGFTLTELLVVIAIIGLLASVVLLSLNRSRASAKVAKVEADLRQVRTAIEELGIDTGKWPNGCPLDAANNPEIALNTPAAGLGYLPPVGLVQDPCEWTDADIAGWRGPYLEPSHLTDPWGTPYYFDPDYHKDSEIFPALVSWGTNGTVNTYDGNDIYVKLR